MGTFKPGAMGVVKGLIDTIVASKWKDTYVIKGRPTKSSKAPSLKQADQHQRFALVTTLLKRINPIISVGYQNTGKNLTPMNAASRYHLASAVMGAYPNYKLDFTKLKLSSGNEGTLDVAWRAKVVAGAGGLLTVSWELKEGASKLSSVTDMLTILFYDVDEDSFTTLDHTAQRSELSREESFYEEYFGHNIHCYVFMVSEDGKRVSKSQYLGQVKLLA